MSLTYASYLKINELLNLQETQSKGKAHDEMLFIVMHQTHELWFKEILHEIDRLSLNLDGRGPAPQIRSTLTRIIAIIKMLVAQMDILETMSPGQFLAFRDLLGGASGFQSAQFREIEFALGNKRREVMQLFPEESSSRIRLQKRFEAATLWDSFLHYLSQHDYAVPEHLLNRDLTRPVVPSKPLQSVLLAMYDENAELANICELFLNLDEGIQEWRYRHLKMVERIIGSRIGTGGSTGVEYLKSTLFNPSFPDLWAIRSQFKKHDIA